MRRNSPPMVGALLLTIAGCNSNDEGYKLSLSEAMSRLDNADVTGFRNARECGLLIHFSSFHLDDHSINYTVRTSGREVASFTVSLAETDGAARATILVPSEKDGGEIYDGTQHYSHPALMQPLRPAIRELVNAAMEQRRFDWRKIPEPLQTGPNDSLTNCGMGRDSLMRGAPVSLDDPEGMPHDEAVKYGLVR
jgi:hypothetical protein